jgi:hypothetical protein
MNKITRTLATSALLVLPVIAVAQLSLTSHALPIMGEEVKITTDGGTSVIIQDDTKKVEKKDEGKSTTVTVAGERKEVTSPEENTTTKVEVKKDDKAVTVSTNASDTAVKATSKRDATTPAAEVSTTTSIPTTGPAETLLSILGLGLMTYLAVRLYQQRRTLRTLGV